jgi:hypothetical protein
MIKAFGVLSLLAILLSEGCGQDDYLGGGYVGRGDYGDRGQYFTDPIFYMPNSGYVSPYPAYGGYQRSAYAPKQAVTLGDLSTAKVSVGQTSASASSYYASSIAGSWHLELSDGSVLNIALYQSSSRLFGRGSLAFASGVQGVVADGAISSNTITLDVVPESGAALYSFSLDTRRLQAASQYTLFRAGAEPVFGTARASKTA